MKILVTGGAGFIGKNLCLKLLKKGHEVVVIDNLITSSKADFKNFLTEKNLTFIEGDVCNLKLIKKIQSQFQFDQIYHLACPTGVPNIKPLAMEMLMTCSVGTKNILDLALTQEASLLFTSSSEIYGDPEKFPQTEEYTGNVDPVGYRSPYEEGKRFSESLIKSYVNKFNLHAKIVRLFNTYGPHMSFAETRVVPQFIRQASLSQPLTILGQGNQKRTFCYVQDLVRGLDLVMNKGEPGEVYNLGSDQEITIKKLAELIIKLLSSKSKIKLVKTYIPDHKRRKPDLSKVKKLGWSYHTKLEEGILKTLEFFRQPGL